MTNRYLIHQGDLLRTLRKERGMIMRDVSEKSRVVSLGYLSEIERADKVAHPDVIESLCSLYGIKHSEFLRRVADSMDLFDEDVLQWPDENTMSADRLPAGRLAR